MLSADWRAREALRVIDELARSEPRQIDPSFSSPRHDIWQTIARGARETCDLEEEAAQLLDGRDSRRNGGGTA